MAVLQRGQRVQAIPAHFSGELRALAESIRGSILTANPDVRWDSIVGLGEAAKLLKEAVIQPIKYPELFTGMQLAVAAETGVGSMRLHELHQAD